MSRTCAFKEDDILLELDAPRAIGDMAVSWGIHYRTKVHPLYVLLANPWGTLASKLVHWTGHAVSSPILIFNPDWKLKPVSSEMVQAAVLLNSFLGAAGVALAFVFFWLFTKRLVDASLFAALFGISASQLLLSVIPDTASLAICSLLVTYLLFFRALGSGRTRLPVWILAGVFSLGVTTTNCAQTVICFAVADFIARRRHGLRHLAIRLLALVGGILAIAVPLSLLQRQLYPSSELFFLPEAYNEEMQFASLLVFRSPLPVVAQLLKCFSWINFIAPAPVSFLLPRHRFPSVSFSSSLDFSVPGIIASVLWFGLWIALVLGAFRRNRTETATENRTRPLLLGFLLCLFFNILLHSIYGVGEKGNIEYFLYSGNFTFLVLALWAIPRPRPKWAFRLLVLALIVCMGINNLIVSNGIQAVYAGL